MSPYVVKKAETHAEILAAKQIRYQVFIDEQGYDPTVETEDKDDPYCTLFVLYTHEGEAIGTIRVKDDTNQLGRFVIIPEYRGKGLAKLLLDALQEHVRRKGGSEVWCEVQADTRPGKVDARATYLRAGYAPVGDLWLKFGCYHQNMVFDLNKLEETTPQAG